MTKYSLVEAVFFSACCFVLAPDKSTIQVLSDKQASLLTAGDIIPLGVCAFGNGVGAHWCSEGCTSTLTLDPNSTSQKANFTDYCTLVTGCGLRAKAPVACSTGGGGG